MSQTSTYLLNIIIASFIVAILGLWLNYCLVHKKNKFRSSNNQMKDSNTGALPPISNVIGQVEIIGGTEQQKWVLESQKTTIGRTSENNIVLNSNRVSRSHCIIIRKNDKYLIQDRLSTNGTIVNNHYVTEVELNTNDIIRIGEINLLFTLTKIF